MGSPSTAVVCELREKLSDRGIAADIRQCDVFSVRNNLQGVNVIAYTCALKEDFGVPKVSAVGCSPALVPTPLWIRSQMR